MYIEYMGEVTLKPLGRSTLVRIPTTERRSKIKWLRRVFVDGKNIDFSVQQQSSSTDPRQKHVALMRNTFYQFWCVWHEEGGIARLFPVFSIYYDDFTAAPSLSVVCDTHFLEGGRSVATLLKALLIRTFLQLNQGMYVCMWIECGR